MSKYSNRRVQVELGVEPVRGGGPAGTTVKYLIPKASITFDDKAPKIKKSASLGDISMNRGDLLEDQFATGTLEGELRSESFGLLLLNMIGTVQSANTDGAAYTHTYTIENTNAPDSIYIKIYDPDKAKLFRNVAISKLEVKVVMGDVVKFTADWEGKKSVSTTNTQISRITEYNFTKNHANIYVAANTSSFTTRLSVKEYTLTFDRGTIEKDSSLGTSEPEDFFQPNGMTIKGAMTLNYEDQTWENYMKQNTLRAMRFDLVNTDVTIGGSSNPKVLADFTNVYFEEWEPDPALEDIRKQSISFEAHWDEINQVFFDDMQVVNTQAAYA